MITNGSAQKTLLVRPKSVYFVFLSMYLLLANEKIMDNPIKTEIALKTIKGILVIKRIIDVTELWKNRSMPANKKKKAKKNPVTYPRTFLTKANESLIKSPASEL